MTPSDFRWHAVAPSGWDLTGFGFAGQPVSHLLFFGVGVILFGISVAGALLALTDTHARFRWLWALGCLIGLGKAALMWKAGGGDFYPISMQVPMLVLRGTTTGDFIVEFGVPVVALIYLSRRACRVPVEPAEELQS